jgi:hypothetical protein
VSDALCNRAVVDEGNLFTMSSQYMSIHSVITSIQLSSHKPEKGNKFSSQLIPSGLRVSQAVVFSRYKARAACVHVMQLVNKAIELLKTGLYSV